MFWKERYESSRNGLVLMANALEANSSYAKVVLVFFSSSSLVSSFLIDILVQGGRGGALLASAISLLPPLIFLHFYKYEHEKIKRYRNRVISTLFAYAFATFLRGLTTFVLGLIVVQPERPLFDRVLPLGIPLFMALLMGSVVAYRDSIHLELVTRLSGERDRLFNVSKDFELTLAESRAELLDQIHSELRPAIEQVKVELQRVQSSPDDRTADAVDALSSLVSDVVRPLSHQLATSNQLKELADLSTDKRTKVNLYLQTPIPVSGLMNMRFVAGVEIFETLILGPLMRVESGSIVGDLLNTFFTLFVAKFLVKVTPHRWRNLVASRAVLLWIGYFAISLVGVRTSTSMLIPSVFGNEYFAAHLAFRLVFVLGFVGIGIIKQLDSIADHELQTTVEQLEQLVSRLRRELNTQRRELSWVLHGPVQSALISTAVEIEMAKNSGKPLVGFAQRMEEVVSSIGTSHTRTPDLDVLINEMKDVWGHSIAFETSISNEARKHLEQDFSLASSAVEFVREGVANAFRHAEAQNVEIRIHTKLHGALNIEIINDGKPLSSSRTKGLGSSIFDEICWRWTIESQPDFTTKLTALMPCASGLSATP